MRIEVKNIDGNPVNNLRRFGYSFQRQEGDERSFIRPLAAAGYPRFHMYVKMDGADMMINIHLDMKKETYGENTRHHGEYGDEGALKEEARRLKVLLG
ncbi:MAG TPA: hypothetical protein DCS28_01880 [Candidatus Moranbacteria bacterium]|nr:hypothetical protein [Candidatus Moranbacteria bacterium]HAT74769.1 hypothetical protein [Candidatus Moranbacteria bacterium]